MHTSELKIPTMNLSEINNTEVVEISGTSDSPKVVFDYNSGKFSFSGRSLPQNPKEFYNPLLKWISAYSKQPHKETHLVFNMEYFNTASSKMILEVIEAFKQSENAASKLKIDWHYFEDDEEMYDTGKEFSEMTNTDFNYFAYV